MEICYLFEKYCISEIDNFHLYKKAEKWRKQTCHHVLEKKKKEDEKEEKTLLFTKIFPVTYKLLIKVSFKSCLIILSEIRLGLDICEKGFTVLFCTENVVQNFFFVFM